MNVAWFARFTHGTAVDEADRAWLEPVLAATPGVSRVLVHTPAGTHDPYLDDGPPPALVLQLHFEDVEGLGAAQRHLRILATPGALPSLRGATATQQAMLMRTFPVREPREATALCSYLVAYEGDTDDPAAWVDHYTTHHTAVMARFPGIREIEVGTPVGWRAAVPWPRVNHLLHNRVVFDNAEGLTAALNSPVRHDMRRDFATFPRFTGPVTHFPMRTASIAPARAAGARPG